MKSLRGIEKSGRLTWGNTDTILNHRQNLFKVINWFRPCMPNRIWHWLELGRGEGGNQARSLWKGQVYAMQYQSYKCTDRGHRSDKAKNSKWVLKMETSVGKDTLYHIPGEREDTWMEWVFSLPSHKAIVRGYWEEYRSRTPLHKNFVVSCKREGVMNLDLKAIFTGEMLKHILI